MNILRSSGALIYDVGTIIMKCDFGVIIDSKSENRSDQTIRWLLVSVVGTLIKIIYLL